MKHLMIGVALVAFALCSNATAEDLGTLKCQLVMADGTTCAPGVQVSIVDVATGKTVATCRADEAGSLPMVALPAGLYRLVTEDGTSTDVAVTPGVTTPTTVKVKPDVRAQGDRRGGQNKKMLGIAMIGAFTAGVVIVCAIIIIFCKNQRHYRKY